ncbi:uncharacterized protein PITG_22359, partial [Phytophthora infestans T30-4]
EEDSEDHNMSSELLDKKDDTLNDVHDGDQSGEHAKMPEQVVFEKVKSNGSVVRKQVPVFRDVYFVFMGYGHSEEDQPGFVEDIQMLLRDDDLLMFNEIVAEEQLTDNNVALTL